MITIDPIDFAAVGICLAGLLMLIAGCFHV